MNATVLLCCCRWLLVTVLLRAVIPNVQLQEILPLICINLSGHVIINAVEKKKKVVTTKCESIEAGWNLVKLLITNKLFLNTETTSKFLLKVCTTHKVQHLSAQRFMGLQCLG